jgi:iron complex outermembrane receptor protein
MLAIWPCALPAEGLAADPAIRVEVTGSRVKRTDVETALPLQVITRDEIERRGVATVAELMAQVSANLLAFNDQLSVGAQIGSERPRPGLSSVNLRGLGDSSTLVLLNGRRVATYAFDGGAVDVNAIPLAAIERVEILKDGASALYGSDAIAGVVNFVLRKDFSGVELSASGTHTEDGGGNQYSATLTAGWGDLARDRFNAFVTVSWQKDEALRAADRAFSRRGFQPEVGLFNVNPLSFPANIKHPVLGLVNPTRENGCRPPLSVPVPIPGAELLCGYDIGAPADIYPPAERARVFGRATVDLGRSIQLFAELAHARNRFELTLPATPVDQDFMRGFAPVRYPAGGPYYPREFASAVGLSGDLDLSFRLEPLGVRVNDVETRASRALVGLEGRVADWDFSTAVLYSRNEQEDALARGHVSQQRLLDVLASGLVNPFGPSTPEGDALLASTQVSGAYHDAISSAWLIDAKASRDVVALPGGMLAIALGAEARRERLDNRFSDLARSGDLIGLGERQTVAAERDAQAGYVEALVPFARGWELQVAARYDHYDDFGGTANPKVALRWQPDRRLVLRSSWGTAYRVPTLYDLHAPLRPAGMTQRYQDPVRCPVTGAFADCRGRFPIRSGGNPQLQPETATQFNAGLVWEPVEGLSLALDYWKIDKEDTIGLLSETLLFDDFDRWAPGRVVRGPASPGFPSLPGPIEFVVLDYVNLGSLRTSGIDVDLRWRGPATPAGRFTFGLNGTYVRSYELASEGAPAISGVGNQWLGPIPRWRHYASLGWEYANWTVTLAQRFQGGYREPDDLTLDWSTGEYGADRRVGTYSLVDVQAQYAGFRNARIGLGVRNLFDRDPPFTQFPVAFASAGNAYYADPRGRTYYLTLKYAFR